MNLAIIQARMGSTRLPNKVLMELEGKAVLGHIVERVGQSRFVDDIIVATTIDRRDLKIVEYCASRSIRVFVGSENDVLDRYYQAARALGAGNIIRITSDCPMIDPEIIDMIGQRHEQEKVDYSSNTLEETYPDGLDAEIFSFAALENAWKNATLKSDREHVTPFIKKSPNLFKLCSVKNTEDLSRLRWTIDQPEDYEFLKTIFAAVYTKNPRFRMKDAMEAIRNNPRLEEINSGIIRNEGYMKSLKND